MKSRSIGIGLVATLTLLGPWGASAELLTQGEADLRLAQGGGPGMTGSSGGAQSNAGTAIGPKDKPPAAVDSPGAMGGNPRPEVGAGTSQGDTDAQGRSGHAGTSGVQRPQPTSVP
jgi:hypothetical protein